MKKILLGLMIALSLASCGKERTEPVPSNWLLSKDEFYNYLDKIDEKEAELAGEGVTFTQSGNVWTAQANGSDFDKQILLLEQYFSLTSDFLKHFSVAPAVNTNDAGSSGTIEDDVRSKRNEAEKLIIDMKSFIAW